MGKDNSSWGRKQKISTFLVNNGWQEIITYSLVSAKEKNIFLTSSPKDFYHLLASKNENYCYYRQTLIPSHLKTIQYNLAHGSKNLLFFEISSVYAPVPSGTSAEELLTLSATGKIFNQPNYNLVQEMDLFWIKGTLENIFSLCLINEKITFRPISLDQSPWLKVEIFLVQEKIGYLGLQENKETIFFAEISLTKIFHYLTIFPDQLVYKTISNFPTSEKDLSLSFPKNTDYNQVIKEIKRVGGENLTYLKIFDIYQNAELVKKGQQSVSFHLVFQSATKTLEKSEVDQILTNISAKMAELFQAKIRR